MSRFPLTEESSAPEDVKDTFHDFRVKMGLPGTPNFLRAQASAPSVLAGTCELLEHVLLEGRLSRGTKELIYLAVAVDRECSYCTAAHTACCRMLGIDDETIDAVTAGLKGDLPEHIRDLLLFAIKCASAPQELTSEDFASLERHGMDREEALEVIAMSAAAVYATIIADATLLEPDAMFAQI